MIKLDVKDYCHGCVHFEVDVDTPDIIRSFGSGQILRIGDTTIRCAHKDRCEYVNKWTITQEIIENKKTEG